MPDEQELARRIARLLKRGTPRIRTSCVEARKRKAAYTYPPKWREAICATQGWKCAYCRRPMRKEGRSPHDDGIATLDHVVPRSKGGQTQRKNLVAACLKCNGTKGSMSAEEFRGHLASAIEARRAETGTGSVHESAVPQADVQEPST